QHATEEPDHRAQNVLWHRLAGRPANEIEPTLREMPIRLTVLQYSKWPISSEKATLRCMSARSTGTRVSSLDVLYAGWNAAGRLVHDVAVGSYLICAKPLRTLWPASVAWLASMFSRYSVSRPWRARKPWTVAQS